MFLCESFQILIFFIVRRFAIQNFHIFPFKIVVKIDTMIGYVGESVFFLISEICSCNLILNFLLV